MKNQLLTELLFGMGLTLLDSEIEEIERAALAGSWIPEGEGSPDDYPEIEILCKWGNAKYIKSGLYDFGNYYDSGDNVIIRGDVTHWRPIVWPEEGGKKE